MNLELIDHDKSKSKNKIIKNHVNQYFNCNDTLLISGHVSPVCREASHKAVVGHQHVQEQPGHPARHVVPHSSTQDAMLKHQRSGASHRAGDGHLPGA